MGGTPPPPPPHIRKLKHLRFFGNPSGAPSLSSFRSPPRLRHLRAAALRCHARIDLGRARRRVFICFSPLRSTQIKEVVIDGPRAPLRVSGLALLRETTGEGGREVLRRQIPHLRIDVGFGRESKLSTGTC